MPSSSGSVNVICETVHPEVRCTAALQGQSVDEIVRDAMDHGARVHGFTPAYYTHGRLEAMTDAVRRAAG